MCKKQGKSCETCPNKMNCPFSKEVEEDVAAKIMGTGIVKLNI